jgi:hypothetical protein
MYVHRLLKPLGINVSKIAFGLPMGGDLDYADPATLIQALGGRRPMDDGRAETDRERASRPPDDARR